MVIVASSGFIFLEFMICHTNISCIRLDSVGSGLGGLLSVLMQPMHRGTDGVIGVCPTLRPVQCINYKLLF